MPNYNSTITLEDAYSRVYTMRVETSNVLDAAAAKTVIDAFLVDLAAFSELQILAYTVSERFVYTDAIVAGANKDEGATFVARKEDAYKAIQRVPGPVAAVRNSDGTIDLSNALTADLLANWTVDPGLLISDGEVVSAWLKGTLDT